MSRILSSLLLWSFSLGMAVAEDERIWMDAKINGQPVRMIFDTGCDRLVLFGRAANRLHLKVTNPAPDSEAPPGSPQVGSTEVCDFNLWGKTSKMQLAVFNAPEVVSFTADGLVGWNYLSDNVFEFDASRRHMSVGRDLPAKVATWLKLPIQKDSGCLVLAITRSDGGPGTITIDTGSMGEISLSSQNWAQWKADHPGQPLTLTAFFMPGAGTVIREVMYAPHIKLGPLEFSNVLIKEANIAEMAAGGPKLFEASLPLDVLRQQDVIVDGEKGFAYLSPNKIPAALPKYNRLGAVFAPASGNNDDLVAHVAPGTPADKAGIRDGDVLLKVGNYDVTQWRANPPAKPTSLQFEQPDGTPLELTLKRGRDPYHTVAILRDILSLKEATGTEIGSRPQ